MLLLSRPYSNPCQYVPIPFTFNQFVLRRRKAKKKPIIEKRRAHPAPVKRAREVVAGAEGEDGDRGCGGDAQLVDHGQDPPGRPVPPAG